ncbi:hypothetical protein [Microbacterium sp. Marseille-Q6965]|uniref:hypothetical protein n=1 Tax=Microbacterium sp. Marseille-Q6965 TaxID=2965072 RepID=UPI0021B6E9D3|nr:hypothetical protein [Microbacterium sp. Marseille-Q6965]
MTLRELLVTLGRRWYAAAAALGATALLAWYLVASAAGGVYTTRTTVMFLWGTDNALGVEQSIKDQNVIAFAGAVASEVVPGQPTVRYARADAPYHGAGLRQGVQVGLTDYGNQWKPSYAAAEIVVQIVGPSRAWVEERQREALARISHSTALHRQPGQITDIKAEVDPLSTRIDHIAPSRTGQLAGLGALGAAGLIAAGGAAVATDRAAHAWRPRARTNARERGDE